MPPLGPEWARGPYKTSVIHALITVVPALAIFLLTDDAQLATFASDGTLGYYWGREYHTTGLRPREGEGLSWGERWDTWMDAIFPTVAVMAFHWWLS